MLPGPDTLLLRDLPYYMHAEDLAVWLPSNQAQGHPGLILSQAQWYKDNCPDICSQQMCSLRAIVGGDAIVATDYIRL